jgi:phage-related tail fiber protein
MKKWIIIFIFIVLSIKSEAQIPQLISYQGVLTDNSGVIVADASYSITFKLYTVSTAGSAIWTETQTTTTSSGIFNVNLGAVTPFTIGFSSQYYLGISVSGGAELSPRTQLTSAAYSLNGNPAGAIIAYGGTSAPSGYLICDGSAISRTTYSALFSAIGTAFGSGDGATTFNLPDFRGRFLRGYDGSAGNDPDKATRTAMNSGGNTGNNLGSVQDDTFQNHQHDGSEYAGGGDPMIEHNLGNGVYHPDYPTGFVVQNPGIKTGTETRPKNAYVNYIIKY